jgi:hypothetical protein
MHAAGCCFALTSHPFLTGRLGRLRALEQLVEIMTSLPDLWVATAGEVARHIRSLGLAPRVFPRPEVSD